MDATLKERAQKVATYRSLTTRPSVTQIAEVAEVYRLLTGKTSRCNSCNFYGFINAINSKLNQVQEPLKIKNTMATKGHFLTNAGSKEVIRHTKNGPVVITPENINEGDNFAWISNSKNGYSHLVAETKAAKEAAEETAPAKTEAKTATTTAKK